MYLECSKRWVKPKIVDSACTVLPPCLGVEKYEGTHVLCQVPIIRLWSFPRLPVNYSKENAKPSNLQRSR